MISVKDADIIGKYIAMGTLDRAIDVRGVISLGVASKFPGIV